MPPTPTVSNTQLASRRVLVKNLRLQLKVQPAVVSCSSLLLRSDLPCPILSCHSTSAPFFSLPSYSILLHSYLFCLVPFPFHLITFRLVVFDFRPVLICFTLFCSVISRFALGVVLFFPFSSCFFLLFPVLPSVWFCSFLSRHASSCYFPFCPRCGSVLSFLVMLLPVISRFALGVVLFFPFSSCFFLLCLVLPSVWFCSFLSRHASSCYVSFCPRCGSVLSFLVMLLPVMSRFALGVVLFFPFSSCFFLLCLVCSRFIPSRSISFCSIPLRHVLLLSVSSRSVPSSSVLIPTPSQSLLYALRSPLQIKQRMSRRKYVFDVTSVGQRSSPWSVNSVKVEISFTSSASSIFLVHNLCCDKCI